MSKNLSVIEINGNRYNAITGQLVGASTTAGSHFIRPSSNSLVDGFSYSKSYATHSFKKIATSASSVKPKVSLSKKHQTKPAQTVHHRTQHSKTLMRGLVGKPAMPKRETEKLKMRSNSDRARASKAMNIVKNSNVRRFGNPITSTTRSTRLASSSHAIKQAISGEVINHKPKSKSTAMTVAPLPSMVTSVSHRNLERMLDEALIKADSHKQALSGRRSAKHGLWQRIKHLPTWLVVGLTVLVIALTATFFAWRNVPQASMKLAAMQAKIKASVPAYTPSGFKFAGPIKYANGAVTLIYKAAGSAKTITITQQASNWDSSSLEANSIPKNSQVQTSQVKGTTIYIYDSNHQATWVSNGIHYVIKNNAQLDTDQLFKIADSL